jgi:N-acetylmuramoyl-L-alanine amidase
MEGVMNMKKNCLRVSIVFLSLLVSCFIPLVPFAQTEKHCIVIDAAHGGEDIGVLGIDKIAEKDLSLAIAKALYKELSKEPHINVVLTRDSDKTISIVERKKKIMDSKPVLVLSLHANAGFSKTSSGYELYFPGFKNIDLDANNKNKKNETTYLNDTVKFARLVQKNLDVLFPRKGRGLREAATPLTDDLEIPILIVEIGFVTNPDEKSKLSNEKMHMEIAKALAKSIKSFF